MFEGVASLSLMTMNDWCKTTELLPCILGVVLSGILLVPVYIAGVIISATMKDQ